MILLSGQRAFIGVRHSSRIAFVVLSHRAKLRGRNATWIEKKEARDPT